MSKENNENNSTTCWICDNDYIDNEVKVRDRCHITGTYRGHAHRDCNIILILILIKSKNFCCISRTKKFWVSSYYERTRQIQS